ncbi:MAG: RloB family protein [Alphaproteobacteria bacterium]
MGRSLPKLQRKSATREAKARFVIFCEGKNTEPAYFKAFRAALKGGALIEIKTVGGAGVPYPLAEAAVKAVEEARSGNDSFTSQDRVCAVFDRDRHPRFDEAVELCENNNILVGRSNPCFELWLILHKEDYDRSDDECASLQKHLRTLCPEYDHGRGATPDCNSLVRNVEDAEKRAAKQLEERAKEGFPHGPPSTTVGTITATIREVALKAIPPGGRS